jgi:putative transposase
VSDAIEQHSISERRACRLTRLARSSKRRVLKVENDSPLKTRLCELARQRQRFGYRRLTVLLQREGWTVNHKRIYRLYCEQGLALRRKRRGHRMRQLNAAMEKNMLTKRNQRWAMDFVSDTLANGRPFRSLTIVDEYTRECPAIEVDTSLPGLRVVRVLQQLADTRGLPNEIRVDHGPEFVSRSVRSWCEEHNVLLRYTDPGRPMQNGHVESFNGRFRDECLNANWFKHLAHARHMIENWRGDYNRARPHSALDYLTPNEFAALLAQRQPQPTMMGKLCL